MNLNQITAFRAVMNSASISEAAQKLGRTQPAVSLAIRSLEETLDLKLFERRGRQLVPVPEAHYLLSEASEILDRLNAVATTMKGLIKGHTGRLNIAAMPGPSAFLLPRYISQAIQDHPNIEVSLSSRTSLQIRELAATQSFDFGFADLLGGPKASQTYRQELITADCYCAIPSDHPIGELDSVTYGDLDGVPMGSLQSTHILRKRTVDAMRRAGAEPKIVLDSQYFLPLMQFVSAGRCLAIVDPLTVVTERELNSTKGRVTFRPMQGAFRYEYALLSPLYRPLSQLANRVKAGWRAEVIALLTAVGANPKTELVEFDDTRD